MSLPTPKKRPFTWFLFIPAIALGMVLFATDLVRLPRTSDDTPRTSFNGGMRGMVFLITFPSTDDRVERLNISIHHSASRVLSSSQTRPTYSDEITVPPDLWQALEDTRQMWCDNSPEPAQPIDETKVYSIAIDCNRIVNPIVYLPAEQFPHALRELLAIVPPPSHPH